MPSLRKLRGRVVALPYIESNEKMTDWRELESKYIMHTAERVPVTLVKGKGARVWDENGREYLDFVAGWAVDSGHTDAHTMVAKAVAQANELAHFVTHNAVQVLGGHGYIQDHPVEKWMRDVRAHTILFGQTHLQNMVIADEALGGGGRE